MKTWLRARLREKSTYAGIALVLGAVLAGPLGYSYADLKDAILAAMFGVGLMGANTTKEQE